MALILAPKSHQCICFFPLPTSSNQRESLDCFLTWISWLNLYTISVDLLRKANVCFAGLITAAGELLEMATANAFSKAQAALII